MFDVVKQDVLLTTVPSPSFITSLAVAPNDSELYLGYSTGALVVYNLDIAVPPIVTTNGSSSPILSLHSATSTTQETYAESTSPSANACISKPQFSNKSLDALFAISDPNLLLTFSDNTATVYDRISLKQVSQLSEVKSPSSADCSSNVIENAFYLAIGMHRKLILYKFTAPFTIVKKREYSLSVATRSISFHPQISFIAIASSREISLLNLDTAEVTSLFSWHTVSFSLRSVIRTKVQYKSQSILAFNSQSLFKMEDGVQTKSDWTVPLEDFFSMGPFLLGLLQGSKSIQIKLNQKLIQTFSFQGPIKWCSTTNRIYTIDNTKVTRVTLLPLEEIVITLRKSHRYDECIALIEAQELSKEDKDPLLFATRLACSYHLFSNSTYAEAMYWFKELRIYPSWVVALYPFFSFLPNLLLEFNHFTLPPSPFPGEDSTLHDTQESKRALSKFLLEWRSILNRLRNTYSDPSLLHSATSSINFSTSSLSSASSSLLSKLSDEWTPEDVLREASVVDTALLTLYLVDKSDAMLGPLIRVKNHCHVLISAELLSSHKKFSELIDFYQGKEMHAEALELLKQLSTATEDGSTPLLKDFDAYLAYLRRLETFEPQFPLLFDHLFLIFKIQPQKALEYLYRTSLPFRLVVEFLASFSIMHVVEYMERKLQHLNDSSTLVNEDMPIVYLQYLILGLEKEPENVQYEYKLRRFLETSDAYPFSVALKMIPESRLEEKLIVYRRTNDHINVFDILVNQMKNLKRAQEFVDEACKFHDKLISVCQQMAPEELPTLISRYAHYLSLETICKAFPPDSLLKDIASVVAAAYARCQARVHQSTLVKNLAYKEHVVLQLQQAKLHSGSIIIDDVVVCYICNKRIGTSAFVTWKNSRKVAHYGCQASAP